MTRLGLGLDLPSKVGPFKGAGAPGGGGGGGGVVGWPSLTFDSADAVSALDTETSTDGFLAALRYAAGPNGVDANGFSQTTNDPKIAVDTSVFMDATEGFDLTATVRYTGTLGVIFGVCVINDASLASGPPEGPMLGIDRRFSRFRPQHYNGVSTTNPVAWSGGSNVVNLPGSFLTLDTDYIVGIKYDPTYGSYGAVHYYYGDLTTLRQFSALTEAEAAFFTSKMYIGICQEVANGNDDHVVKDITTGAMGDLI